MIKSNEWKEYENRLAGVISKECFKKINYPRPNKEIIDKLKSIEDPTPTISDILDELGINGTIPVSVIKPAISGKVLVGPALTIKYVPERIVPKQAILESKSGKLGDKDAYVVSKPGDVIVFDNGGRETISTIGGLSVRYALKAGIAGCIVDGGLRDVSEIRRLGFSAWSRGITPISGKLRVKTIEVNGEVTCGGVLINPGDLVVADDNGICIIPYEKVDEVIELTIKAVENEKKLVIALEEGYNMDKMKDIIPPEKW